MCVPGSAYIKILLPTTLCWPPGAESAPTLLREQPPTLLATDKLFFLYGRQSISTSWYAMQAV